MDRRSWLWRRKSSEKSPGETESTGSISSHSERFSDDQVYATLTTQLPDFTSKAGTNDEQVNNNVKSLTENLSAALLNVRAKEELVKQHAKVAEEAVAGWEKTENEAASLRKQLETANQKGSALETRVSHLDGALKECVRQLRQARDERDQKIHEVVESKNSEWESKRSELEGKIIELESQLQAAEAKAGAINDSHLSKRLEAVEKKNSELKLELQSRYEELEFRIIERDLSTQAAEAASKQHFQSIKKLAKVEAECRRLKATVRKGSLDKDHKSTYSSSVYAESYTDSQSDNGESPQVAEADLRKAAWNELETINSYSWASALATELGQFKHGNSSRNNPIALSNEINLMDDFLEMEKFAALPDKESGSCSIEMESTMDKNSGGSSLKAELELITQRNSELVIKLEKQEAERAEIDVAFSDCHLQLETTRNQLEKSKLKLAELQSQLALTNRLKQDAYEELKATKNKNENAESELKKIQAEKDYLVTKIGLLEAELQKQRNSSAANMAKITELENELSNMRHGAETLHERINGELKLKQDKELAVVASKFADCQKTIASLDRQLQSLATLEEFMLEPENPSDLALIDDVERKERHEQPLKFPTAKRESATMISSNSKSSISNNDRSRSGLVKFFPISKSVTKTTRSR